MATGLGDAGLLVSSAVSTAIVLRRRRGLAGARRGGLADIRHDRKSAAEALFVE